MVSEPSEDVRAQRCQRACESMRAANHPPGQSAVRLGGEELRVSVSVRSDGVVRQQSRLAQPRTGVAANEDANRPAIGCPEVGMKGAEQSLRE